ncbi:MAG TPA: cupin domain-containing protein [Casimicrobiaceae bacterium]|nr:cupin domain-containing protein [Casimicrobiaceae bacterium]
MAASDYPLLTALMAPCTAEAFLREHWPSRAMQVHGPRERLPSLLLDPVLASAAELAQRYSGPLRFTHGGTERMVTVSDVNAVSLLDMGLTVQFLNLPSVLSGVPAFLRQLEGELGLHANSIMFSVFAAPREGGLVCHFDNCDLISVQLAGSKHFHYAPEAGLRDPTGGQYVADTVPFDDLYAQACTGFPDPTGAHFETALMEPGSVLFVPRGSWHYTEASDNSLSVSIVADPPAALRCLLDQLGMLLLQDARWRRPLIGGLGDSPRDAQTRAQLAQLLETLPEIVGRLAPEDLLSAPASAAWRMQRIGPSTRFARTPFARIELGTQRANGMLPLTFRVGVTRKLTRPAAQMEVSATTVPLMRWIEAQTHGPFAASDLAAAFPDESFATLRQLLQRCVQAQFLRLLWFPALVAGEPHP